MNPILRPSILVDKGKCVANILRMKIKADSQHAIFRPHFKTHQSAIAGEWFREAGISAITVSSVSMAEYFAEKGWDDITIAFSVNLLEIESINRLAAAIRLNLLIESVDAVLALRTGLTGNAGFFIKIDTGYHRTGVDPENYALIDAILHEADKSMKLKFKGFLTHTGQTYGAGSVSEIREYHQRAGILMNHLKEKYVRMYPDLMLSSGDTPSCSLFGPFPGIDEIRPGNFVFYDLMQVSLGSCELNDVAAAVICPVVAVHSDRDEAVLYGGAVHLSKESWMTTEGKVFGLALRFNGESWDCYSPLGYLTSLSQEHGILRMNPGIHLKAGNLVAIVPVHSCLAAHQFREEWVLTGD